VYINLRGSLEFISSTKCFSVGLYCRIVDIRYILIDSTFINCLKYISISRKLNCRAKSVQARLSHRRLRVVRIETTVDTQRIVGLLVPNAAVETVLQGSLSKTHPHFRICTHDLLT